MILAHLPRLVLLISASLLPAVSAAGFTASGPPATVQVLAGFPQGGELIRLTPEAGSSLGAVSAQPAAAWLKAVPSENRSGEIDLVFDPRGMSAGTYQTSVTVNAGGTPQAVPVSMQVSASNQIKQIIADPWRSRVYLLADGASATLQSRIVVLDAVDGSFVREIAVKRAHSMSESPDGKYLYTMQAPANAVMRVDLQRMRAEPEIPLPAATASSGKTFSSLCAGNGKVVYFLDAALSGKLFAVDLNAGTVIQQINTPPTAGSSFGRLCLSPDGSRLCASVAAVTVTGTQGPFELLMRYDVGADGTLSAVADPERPLLVPTTANAPLTMSGSGRLAVLGDRIWQPGDFTGTEKTFPSYVRGTSADGEVVAGDAGIYNDDGTRKLLVLPFVGTPQAMTVSPEGHVFYAVSSAFGILDPTTPAANAATLFPVHPRDGSAGPAPLRFRWTPVDGAREYRVYFATDAAALQSPQVQVAGSTQSFVSRQYWLDNPLAMSRGETRYWRVDALAPGGLVRGPVMSFSVADFGIEARAIEMDVVKGCRSQRVKLQPVLPANGALSISGGSAPWLKPPVESGGDFTIDTTLMPSKRESTVLLFENAGMQVSVLLTVNLHSCPGYDLIVDPNAPLVHALVISADGANFVARVNAANGTILDSQYIGQGGLRICLSPDGDHLGIQRALNGNFANSGGVEVLKAGDYSREAVWVSHFTGPSSTTSQQSAFGPADRMAHAGRLINWRTGQIFARSASNNGAISVISPDGSKGYYSNGSVIQSFDMNSPTLALLATYTDPAAGGEDRPAISRDGSRLASGRVVLDENLQVIAKGTDDIRTMSADGKILLGNEGLYHIPSLRRFGNSPGPLQNLEISDVARTLVRFRDIPGSSDLNFTITSYDASLTLNGGSIVPTTPSNSLVTTDTVTLRWSDLTAAGSYRVFFGTDQAAVAAAVAGSPLELGVVTSAQWPTAIPLANFQNYYWKVIAEGPYASSSSPLWSFRTSDFRLQKDSMALLGPVAGALISAKNTITAPAGRPWTISTTTPWIQLPVTSGNGSGNFEVRAIPATTEGTRTGSIRITIGSEVVDLPVSFFSFRYRVRDYVVDPALGVMHLLVAPVLADLGLDRLYLMRVDLQTLAVLDVFDTGLEHQGNGDTHATTRMVVHPQDNRLYVYHSTAAKVVGYQKAPYDVVSQFSTTPLLGSNLPGDMTAGGVAGRLAISLPQGGIAIVRASDGQNLYGTSGNDNTGYSVMRVPSAGDRLYALNPDRLPKFFDLGANSIGPSTTAASSVGLFGVELQVSADGSTVSYNQGFYNRDLTLLGSIPNVPSAPERIVAISANGAQFLASSGSGVTRWAAKSGSDPILPGFKMHGLPKVQWDSTRGRMFYRTSSSSYDWMKTLAAGELPLPTIIGSDGWTTSGPADWKETSPGSGVLRTPAPVMPASSEISATATLAFKSKLTGTLHFDWRNTTNGSEIFDLIINGTSVETRSATTSFVTRAVIVPTNSTVEFSYYKPGSGTAGTAPAGELRNIFMTFSGASQPLDEARMDSDGDGASDLLEKALGSDPQRATSYPSTRIGLENGVWTFAYERPAGLRYRYEVQVSDDLQTWETLAADAARLTEPEEGKEHVDMPVPAGRSRAFMRLQVTPL